MAAENRPYAIGVMVVEVEGQAASLRALVERAMERMQRVLADEIGLRVDLFDFVGPHLVPSAGGYAPLDFLQIGLAEKLERDIDFMLIVTEVDLSSRTQSYTLALPSQLTNLGIISTKRLSPEFWGLEEDSELTARRLGALMLHTLGHLLNLPHHESPTNVMRDFHDVDELERMEEFTPEQVEILRRNVVTEARERVTRTGVLSFAIRRTLANWRSILSAVRHANPLGLPLRMPTMLTAALSVIVVLFFSAEIWDVAASVESIEMVGFSIVALIAATTVLYRAFTFGISWSRNGRIRESTVITEVATMLSLLLTMLVLYLAFLALAYLATITFFPRALMAAWSSTDPATGVLDHLKLSMFVASMGVLTGSLGARAESRELIRHILFLDEEA